MLSRTRIPLPLQVVLAAVAGVASFVIARVGCTLARDDIHAVPFAAVLLAVVLLFARALGILYALPIGTAAILAYDWFYLPPLRELSEATYTLLATFLGMAVIVGTVATVTSRRAGPPRRRVVSGASATSLRVRGIRRARGRGRPGPCGAAAPPGRT